jgi:hypothetical protein
LWILSDKVANKGISTTRRINWPRKEEGENKKEGVAKGGTGHCCLSLWVIFKVHSQAYVSFAFLPLPWVFCASPLFPILFSLVVPLFPNLFLRFSAMNLRKSKDNRKK